MAEGSPIAIMLAGANGSGKTTTATTLFRETLQSVHFVNADTIALGLSGGDPDSVALQAGAIMLNRLKDLAKQRQSFAFETTGASRSFAAWIKELQGEGYHYNLVFLWLRTADVAVERVAERVRGGGHNIPAETIRRRYLRGLNNLFKLYLPLANKWTLIDNNDVASPRLIAEGKALQKFKVHDKDVWAELNSRYNT